MNVSMSNLNYFNHSVNSTQPNICLFPAQCVSTIFFSISEKEKWVCSLLYGPLFTVNYTKNLSHQKNVWLYLHFQSRQHLCGQISFGVALEDAGFGLMTMEQHKSLGFFCWVTLAVFICTCMTYYLPPNK